MSNQCSESDTKRSICHSICSLGSPLEIFCYSHSNTSLYMSDTSMVCKDFFCVVWLCSHLVQCTASDSFFDICHKLKNHFQIGGLPYMIHKKAEQKFLKAVRKKCTRSPPIKLTYLRQHRVITVLCEQDDKVHQWKYGKVLLWMFNINGSKWARG